MPIRGRKSSGPARRSAMSNLAISGGTPVRAGIPPRTRPIMPVPLGQKMADRDGLMEIARRHDLFVVEDCAHAHGQEWGGAGAGCIGDFGSFSHQSTKILTAGEGGTLLTP